jgi:transposase
MLTAARLPKLSEAGIRSVTALTHPQILRLVERKVIEPGLFDEREIAEIYDPASPQVRYLLCRNPLTAEREHRTREALIGKTTEGLEQLARSRKKRTTEAWGAAVGVLLARYKVGKFFAWSIPQNKLEWQLDSQRVALEESLDGCYVVRTDVSASMLDKNQAVASYRRLAEVDRGFRQIKTVSLEIRPTYHQLDRRIEGHVFVCMLAYYLQWQMQQRLAPLFALDGKGKNRRWTFGHVLERLKALRQETVQMDQTEVSLKTTPDAEQQQILDLLGVSP